MIHGFLVLHQHVAHPKPQWKVYLDRQVVGWIQQSENGRYYFLPKDLVRGDEFDTFDECLASLWVNREPVVQQPAWQATNAWEAVKKEISK